jgi:transposase
MRELSVAEQRYQAVLAVIGEGGTVSEVAGRWGMSRLSVHAWLARYEAGGLEGLADRSHRPASCPHQMDPAIEARVLELRRCTGRGARGGSCSSWAGSG